MYLESVYKIYNTIQYNTKSENKKIVPVFKEKDQSEAGQLLKNCLIFVQNLRLKQG